MKNIEKYNSNDYINQILENKSSYEREVIDSLSFATLNIAASGNNYLNPGIAAVASFIDTL